MAFNIQGLLSGLAGIPNAIGQGLLGPMNTNPGLGLDSQSLSQSRQQALSDLAMGLMAGDRRNPGGTLMAATQNARQGYSGRVFDLLKENETARMMDERTKRQKAQDSLFANISPEDAMLAAANPQGFVDQMTEARFRGGNESWRVLTPEEVAANNLDPNSDWQVNTATKKIDKLFSPPAAPINNITNLMPGENKFAETMATDSVSRLNAADTTARAAVGSLASIQVASKSLDKAIVGTGAEIRTSFGRLLNSLGMSNGDGLAATSQYLNSTGQLAAQMLASKIFGAGTGISQKDLEFAIGLVGNDQSLTKPQIQRILSIREKMDRAQIGNYNKLRGTMASQPNYAPYMGPYPEMQIPAPVQWVAPGTKVND